MRDIQDAKYLTDAELDSVRAAELSDRDRKWLIRAVRRAKRRHRSWRRRTMLATLLVLSIPVGLALAGRVIYPDAPPHLTSLDLPGRKVVQ